MIHYLSSSGTLSTHICECFKTNPKNLSLDHNRNTLNFRWNISSTLQPFDVNFFVAFRCDVRNNNTSVLVTWLDVPFQLCRGPQDLDPPYWICQVTRWQPTSVFVLSYCKHGGRPHLLWNRPAVIFLPLLLHPGPRAASAFGPGQTGARAGAGAVQVWGTASHGTGELELEEVLWIRFFKMSIFSCFGLSARPASSPRNMADSRVSWPGWVGMRPSKDTSRSSSEFRTPAHPPGITGKKKNRTWKKFWKWVGRWQILLNVEGLRQKPQFFETLEENFHPEKCTWRRKFGKSFFLCCWYDQVIWLGRICSEDGKIYSLSETF